MLRIAAVHPDVIALQRLEIGAPKLNAEWIELFNAGAQPVNVHNYVVSNSRRESFCISIPKRVNLVIGPYQSLIIFSGHPDRAADPAQCYLANQSSRLFLKRAGYFWDPAEDTALLYASQETFAHNPRSYLDRYFYKRRSAKAVIPHR